jgi:PAS domain S-box-containing protein
MNPDRSDRAHHALHNDESYLRAALGNVLDGIIGINEECLIETFNPAAERIFGYAAAEVMGRNIKILMPEPYQGEHDAYVQNYLRTGQARIIGIGREVHGLRRDGHVFPMDLAVSETRWNGERKFIGIVRDITERKNAEEALLKLNEELEMRVSLRTAELHELNKALHASLTDLRTTQDRLVQSEKMAALGTLVSGVAHEINTPVGICVTAASYLELKINQLSGRIETGDLTHDALQKYLRTMTEAVASISTNLNRAAELVKSFKQVAVDQASEEKRHFELKDYIGKVLLSLRPKYKRTSHSIEVNGPAIEISSYPGALSQIITNMVINSLTHGFEGIENGLIVMEVARSAAQCTLRYSDNGRGIPPENINKIYDPFFTTRRSQESSGLGLHIVYNLVRGRLKGWIECSSTVGQGTAFTITFPCNAP